GGRPAALGRSRRGAAWPHRTVPGSPGRIRAGLATGGLQAVRRSSDAGWGAATAIAGAAARPVAGEPAGLASLEIQRRIATNLTTVETTLAAAMATVCTAAPALGV